MYIFKLVVFMTESSAIKSLVRYSIREHLISPLDEKWAVNRLLERMKMDSFDMDAPVYESESLENLLKVLLDYACENGLCEDSVVYRDLFDTKIMGVLTPRPSRVIEKFFEFYKSSPKEATKYFYHDARRSDYIREY